MTTTSSDHVYFLLVDDLEENLLALEGLLRRDGLTLLKAKSGTAALEVLLKYEVALALVDIQMPGMDGFELAELMRGTARTRRVPIIFLTAGTADRQRRFRGYEAGAVDFLLKPIEPDILRSKADVFFELYRQRQEVTRQRDELKAATVENTRLLKESHQYALALKEADQRKDEFLAMLAHELRNPLGPVRNAVEILRRVGTDEEAIAKAGDIIARQVAHMSRLVDDLLDVARIARGKVQLRAEQCDLTSVVRNTAEDYRPTFANAGVQLVVTMPDQPILLTGDPTRLAQVVGNLLHNSNKFTPADGRVDVQLSADVSSNTAVLMVHDTGAGMEANVLSRIFEPFSQADQNLDRNKGGLGLGLALVKGLAELHGGSVTAVSGGAGKGSTFTLRLPLSKPVAPALDELTDSAPSPGMQTLRILVIEDNRDAALSLQLLLSLHGHEVNVAFDGRAGLNAAREFGPDVVISDLGLPGELNGYDVAKFLRDDPSLGSPFLIALSGYGQDEDRKRAQKAGFDRHLIKPVDLTNLQEALSTVPR
jgi:signal transduction histidine kinase